MATYEKLHCSNIASLIRVYKSLIILRQLECREIGI